ncbi:hypothetical protein C4565_02365 [Candidatus Parcubacteria bacterium]|jgi:protein-L-isoaspartate(D-aspartate) O-methyltransferase|nr:MAG: hypothetical protein C4565_02365 [Candidatus Parcubacteria bacterium]
MTEKECIEQLVEDGYIFSSEVKKAFLAVHRGDFVSDEYKSQAGENIPLPGAEDLFVPQPSTAAFMIELLKPKRGERMLVVGGSGWVPGIIAHIIVGKEKTETCSGLVCVVEPNEDGAHLVTKNLEKYSFISDGIVDVHHGAWDAEYNEHGPYDGVIALRGVMHIPEVWQNMIRVGGRIVAPIDETIIVKEKTGATEYSTKRYFGFNFPQF